MTRCILVFLAVLFALYGCDKTPEQQARELAELKQKNGENYVRRTLKDPDSAQFERQFVSYTGQPCGEVNAKNALGAYVGFRRYIASTEDTVMIEGGDMDMKFFEWMWGIECKKPPKNP